MKETFSHYNNVLDVKKVHEIFKEDTKMEDGLKNSYEWYLNNTSMVNMKDHMKVKEDELYKLIKK